MLLNVAISQLFPSNKLTFTKMDEPPAAPKGPVPVPSAPVAHLNVYLLTFSWVPLFFLHMSLNHGFLSCPIRSHPHPLLNWRRFSCFRANWPFRWLCSGSSCWCSLLHVNTHHCNPQRTFLNPTHWLLETLNVMTLSLSMDAWICMSMHWPNHWKEKCADFQIHQTPAYDVFACPCMLQMLLNVAKWC